MSYDEYVDEEIATMFTAHEDYSDVTEDITDEDVIWLCAH
jgi:hypothetical protein